MIPIILDTDPGIDDAAAITLALKSPAIDVRLITTVVGNVAVDKTTANALRLVEFLEMDIPVAKGASEPLLREHEDSSHIHGASGMDGYQFPELKTEPIGLNAVEAMKQTIEESDESITIVAIGALTNVALLIKEYPEVLHNVKEIVIMGGALGAGNVNSAAEFNVYTDPHAAKIVFDAEVSLIMIGLDITLQTVVKQEALMEVKEANELGHMLYSLFANYNSGSIEGGIEAHDLSAIYYLIYPEKAKTKEYYINVVVEGPAMGATVADVQGIHYPRQKNCAVGLAFESLDHFNEWFVETVRL